MAIDSTTTVSGAPSLTTSTNADVLTGGVFGAIVGGSTSETVGFYGNAGVAQITGTTGYTVAQVVAALQALGLFGA